MTLLRALPLLFLTAIVVALLAYVPSGAADDNRVAVVIDYGNDQIATRCVSFSEASITGFEALERTGLPVETDFQTGGAAVCRIDSQGCPANDCFCSCRGGGDCIYWSYWHLTNGTWNYSAAGSGLYQVTDGAVEGWVWGLGSVTQAQPPPVVAFADVCAAAATNTPTVTATPTSTATRIFLPTAQPTGGAPVATATIAAATAVITTTAALPAAGGAGSPAASPLPTVVRITATIPPPPSTLPNTSEPAPAEAGAPLDSSIENIAAATQPAAAVEANPAESPVIVSSPISQPVEPTGGLLAGGATELESFSTATPVSVAVIGAESGALVAADALPAAPAETATGWPAYAGFAGLLLFLGALALLVYRHRAAGVDQ